MSEFMAGGQFPFNNSASPDVNMELGVYVGDLAEARERALDVTPTFRDRVGMPYIEAMPDLVAEYTNALYKIDRYDSPVITRSQFASLVFLNRQSTEMLVPKIIRPETRYGSLLISTVWATETIENIGQDIEYIEGVRNAVQEVSPQKAIEINIMRFSARVWLDRFCEQEKEAAKFGAAVIFGNLFGENYSDIVSSETHALNPEDVYFTKKDAFENMSNYCFAGVPMSREEARTFAIMGRDII